MNGFCEPVFQVFELSLESAPRRMERVYSQFFCPFIGASSVNVSVGGSWQAIVRMDCKTCLSSCPARVFCPELRGTSQLCVLRFVCCECFWMMFVHASYGCSRRCVSTLAITLMCCVCSGPFMRIKCANRLHVYVRV